MNNKTQSIALALSGFIVIWLAIFSIIEMDIWGVLYAGIVMIVGFHNWIEVDKSSSVKYKSKENTSCEVKE